jgi:hypothetical protein
MMLVAVQSAPAVRVASLPTWQVWEAKVGLAKTLFRVTNRTPITSPSNLNLCMGA